MMSTHHPNGTAATASPRTTVAPPIADDVVLITGGGSGIGRAIAEAMAESGRRVVICGRNRSRLADAEREVPGLTAICCDITDDGDVAAMIGEIDRRFGRLDLLVNNAGMQDNYRVRDEPTIAERVRREVALNVTALVNTTHAALPMLRRSARGRIVNVGSGTGLVPKPEGLVYSATKAAVHSFSDGLRMELAPLGIGVVELIPPVVDTAMTAARDEQKTSPEAVAEALMQGLDRGRHQIHVGKMRFLPWLVRVAPRAALTMMWKGEPV